VAYGQNRSGGEQAICHGVALPTLLELQSGSRLGLLLLRLSGLHVASRLAALELLSLLAPLFGMLRRRARNLLLQIVGANRVRIDGSTAGLPAQAAPRAKATAVGRLGLAAASFGADAHGGEFFVTPGDAWLGGRPFDKGRTLGADEEDARAHERDPKPVGAGHGLVERSRETDEEEVPGVKQRQVEHEQCTLVQPLPGRCPQAADDGIGGRRGQDEREQQRGEPDQVREAEPGSSRTTRPSSGTAS